MSTIHLLAYGWSACSYHLVIAQKTMAVKSDDIAYTSPSTAENQNVSLNVYARAPTAPDPKMAIALATLYVPSSEGLTSLFAKKTMVRYRKNIVKAEQIAFIAFTATAACMLSVNIVKKRAKSWNTGFPGGWPTSSLYDEAMNSPQSQKEAVGSIVRRYVTAATTKTKTAVSLFHKVNFLLFIVYHLNLTKIQFNILYLQK